MSEITMTAGQFVTYSVGLLAPFGVMCVWCTVLFKRAFWAEEKCEMLMEALRRRGRGR